MPRTIEVRGTEHRTPSEALQHLDVSGDDVAFTIGGRHFTASRNELERIQLEGIQPTIWHDLKGRLVSIPGKHG